jgi:glutamyl-tRNA reductase
VIINRTYEHALELAAKLGGTAVGFDDRWQHMLDADIIVSSTSCPHTILSREEAEIISRERKRKPLVLVDIALPRDIDPAVREVAGVFLYDIDDLERVVHHNSGERASAAADAEKIVAAEATGFRRKLLAERVVPTIIALRTRLDEICRQELESFKQECGPFPKDEEQMFQAVTSRIMQRIAGVLARELKELPEKTEQEQMTTAIRRLFHLETPEAALAGARI